MPWRGLVVHMKGRMMQVANISEKPFFAVPGLSWAQFDPAGIMDDADPDNLCCDAGNHEILRVAADRHVNHHA